MRVLWLLVAAAGAAPARPALDALGRAEHAPATRGAQPTRGRPAIDSFGGAGHAPATRGAQPTRGRPAIDSFGGAKRALAALYADHRETLYSGCAFAPDATVDYRHCAYRPRHDGARAHRIEWEHVVPAHAFGRAVPQWRDGSPNCRDRRGRPFRGRACAARASALFRLMEADMHNLFPEIGELNALRGERAMSELATLPASLPDIDARLAPHRFEPRAAVRGDVARAYLYMARMYAAAFGLDAEARAMFVAWDAADPVDAWECERAARIARLQGRANPYVDGPCLSRRAQLAYPRPRR